MAIDNLQDYPIVIKGRFARRVTVKENYNSSNPPTQDLLAACPAGATNVRVTIGDSFVYTPQSLDGLFVQGQTAGTIRTESGSVIIQVVESMQV